ncbi:MAG: DUF4433 domain-containing protein, partial [Lachnospiraceae bacterium]|nr:DUF4433 domain-containing protein [Lachnospiraceae bacterium]
ECMNYFDDEVLREAVRDQALVLSILRTEPGIMDFIEDPVKKDRGFAAKAVTANAAALKYLDDDMRTSLCNDREFLLAALGQKYGYRILENTVRELLTDREFIMEAVKRNGKALNYFGEEAVKDEEIVVTAFEHGYCNAPGGDPEVTEKDYGYLMSDRELRKAVTGKSGRTEQKKCVAMAKKHGVRHLVHFTDVENLGSILKDGMMTRKDLEDRGERAFFSDRQRLDGQTDTISLSIEEPNRLMFAVKRNEYPRRKWCVIRLKTEAVLRNKCYFMSDNAANHSYDRAEIARDERYTVLDFLGMFDYSFTDRKLRRSKIQSEIMCATSIPADAIDSVVFSSAEDVEYYRERYGGKIPFVCDPWYFE